jgi:hypothetical protein
MKYLLLAAVLVITVSVHAQWTTLFNGKDLTGWKELNGKAKYSVQNGEIVGTTVLHEPNSFLATEKEYGDFILEFEFEMKDSMNSGVQFRSLSTADYQNGRVHGYQYEIDPSPRAWTAGIYDEGGRLWLYPGDYNPDGKKAYQHGKWNTCRIECIGNSVRTWLNHVPVANLIDSAIHSGFIALQVHAIRNASEEGREIHFKNIRIQTERLQPSPADLVFVRNLVPNHLSAQEKSNGYALLFDGKTTGGWRRIFQPEFPEKGWEVKDGVLTIHASNGQEEGLGGDIVTDKEYSAFELQFDFKLSPGANSGVKYFVKEGYDSKGKSGIGLEYQVLDDALHPDAKLGKDGNRTLASLYDLIPRKNIPQAFHKIGEWNYGRIIVYPNNHVEHWLNGYKVLEYEKGAKDFLDRVAISKYHIWPNFGQWKEGHILLQDHGNEVSYRSIKIKVLK